MTNKNIQIQAEIKGSDNESILLTIHPAQEQKDAPIVVIAHGFKTHKDWGFLPDVAIQLAKHGFHAVRFSISHSGTNPAKVCNCDMCDPISGTKKTKHVPQRINPLNRPDLFRRNTIAKEIFDYKTVIRSAVNGEIKQILQKLDANISEIFLLGHSRGSATSLLTAVELSDEIKIAGIASWSPTAHFMHYTKKQFADWVEHGFIKVLEPRSRAHLIMDRVYRDDMFDNADRYDLEKATKKLAAQNMPMLLLRAADDNYIHEDEMERLTTWSNGLYELETISGTADSPADHNFGVFNPVPNPDHGFIPENLANSDEALKSNAASAKSTSTTIEQPISPTISWAIKRTLLFFKSTSN